MTNDLNDLRDQKNKKKTPCTTLEKVEWILP